MRSYFSHNVWTSSVCWNFILQNWMRHSVSHYFIYFFRPPIIIHVACLTRQFLNRWYAQGCLRAYQLGSHFCVCVQFIVLSSSTRQSYRKHSPNTRMIMTFSFLFFCHDIYCLDFTMISMEYTRRFMVTTMLKPILVQCSHCVYKCTNKIFSFTNHINIMYDTIRW